MLRDNGPRGQALLDARHARLDADGAWHPQGLHPMCEPSAEPA